MKFGAGTLLRSHTVCRWHSRGRNLGSVVEAGSFVIILTHFTYLQDLDKVEALIRIRKEAHEAPLLSEEFFDS